MNIIQLIEDPNLINDQSLSSAQKMALKAVYGLPLEKRELGIFYQTTGLQEYSPREWDEASFILGRRSGKSDKLASNIALYEACIREHNFSKGELGVVMLVSSELRRQSRILYSYILRKLQDSPFLSKLIDSVTAEEITLTNGVIIQVYPCNVARIRGASLIAFIVLSTLSLVFTVVPPTIIPSESFRAFANLLISSSDRSSPDSPIGSIKPKCNFFLPLSFFFKSMPFFKLSLQG